MLSKHELSTRDRQEGQKARGFGLGWPRGWWAGVHNYGGFHLDIEAPNDALLEWGGKWLWAGPDHCLAMGGGGGVTKQGSGLDPKSLLDWTPTAAPPTLGERVGHNKHGGEIWIPNHFPITITKQNTGHINMVCDDQRQATPKLHTTEK